MKLIRGIWPEKSSIFEDKEGIYQVGLPERKDVECLPPPKDGEEKLVGWCCSEIVGMAVVNPKAVATAAARIKLEEEELTPEEREEERIANKDW